MTVSIKTPGDIDLDAHFAPYVRGVKPALTGIKNSAGTDLSDLYAPLAYGSAATQAGIKVASGADLNALFAKKGTTVYTGDPDFPDP